MSQETREQPPDTDLGQTGTGPDIPDSPEPAETGQLPPSRAAAIGVAGLLAVAFALRLWGVSTGMPYAYLLDEAAYYVPQAIRMFDEGLNPGWFVNPPAFTYLLHLVFAVFSAGGRGIREQFLRDPQPVWLLARAMSALLGTAAVGVIYLAGTKLRDRRTGFFAAGTLAVAFLPVFYGHFALNDSPLLLPVCLALLGIAEVLRGGSRRGYVLAGIGFGLAVATKYSAGVVGISLVLAFVARRREDPFRELLIALGAAAAAFLLVNPFSVLDIGAFLDGLAHQSEASSNTGGKVGQIGSGGLPFYFDALGWGVGWVALGGALFGAGLMVMRDRGRALVLALPPLLFLIFMSTYSRWFGRWAMPAVPFVCLLAGWGFANLVSFLPDRTRWLRPVAAAAALLALTVQGLTMDIHLGKVLSRKDTRAIARTWMRNHIPKRSKIVVEPGVVPQRWLGESVSFSRPFVINDAQSVKRKTWRILSQKEVINGSPETYTASLRPITIIRYQNAGWCWIVTSSTQRGRVERDPKRLPKAAAYYKLLASVGELRFSTSPWRDPADKVPFDYDTSYNFSDSAYVRPGPEIKIYRLYGGRCRRVAS